TDFTDIERARARSLYGLFNTISLGVEGTAMPAFEHLSREQRWALAFFVGSLHVDERTRQDGARALAAQGSAALPPLRELTTQTLAGIAQAQGEDAATVHAWLRVQPRAYAELAADPLAIAMAGVRRSVELYASGDRKS